MDLTTLAAKAAQIGLPAVRAALLGPIGNAALVAVASKLGVPATPAALGAAMDDPETRLALARIDAEMQAEGNRHAEAVLADVQRARDTHKGHWMTWLLPLILIGLFAAWNALLAFVPIGEPNLKLMNPERVSQTIETLLVAGVFYWLGSNKNSIPNVPGIRR